MSLCFIQISNPTYLLGIIIYLNLLQKYNLMNWVYFFNLQCQIVMKDLTLTTGCPSPNTVYRCKDNNNYSWSPSLNCLSAWSLVTPEMASSSVGEAEAGCQDVWYSQYSQRVLWCSHFPSLRETIFPHIQHQHHTWHGIAPLALVSPSGVPST